MPNSVTSNSVMPTIVAHVIMARAAGARTVDSR